MTVKGSILGLMSMTWGKGCWASIRHRCDRGQVTLLLGLSFLTRKMGAIVETTS